MNTKEDVREVQWSNMITEIAKQNVNVSIVGWQNIYDNEGNIEKVVALELAFPVKDKSKIHLVSKDDEETTTSKRSSPDKAYREFGHFVKFIQRGLQVDIFALEHKRNCEVTEYFYWSPHTIVSILKENLHRLRMLKNLPSKRIALDCFVFPFKLRRYECIYV
jgi:hypothetical protein